MILDGALYLIGAAVVLKSLYDFAYFVTLYLSAPSVHRYLHGIAPYALITGATDGIGKATAKELYKRGFNIILHGRNHDKLRQVEEELRKLGNKDVKIWVEDACRDSIDFGTAVAQWEGLEITLVVHNVGGVVVRAERWVLSSCRRRATRFLTIYSYLPYFTQNRPSARRRRPERAQAERDVPAPPLARRPPEAARRRRVRTDGHGLPQHARAHARPPPARPLRPQQGVPHSPQRVPRAG